MTQIIEKLSVFRNLILYTEGEHSKHLWPYGDNHFLARVWTSRLLHLEL